MRQITEIGSEPRQKLTLIGENNERITFRLEYKPTQQAWYFDLEYLEFSVFGQKLLNSPNFLRQYINSLPFGIACVLADGTDPYFVDDFLKGRASIFLLNEAEVNQIEEALFS